MPRLCRVATPGDARGIHEIYAPVVATSHTSFEEEVPSVAEMAARVEERLEDYPWLVEEQDGVVTGFVYGSAHRSRAAYRWSVDTTVYVRQSARRRGTGRRLYGLLLDLLEAQGYTQAFAGIALPNAPSVAFHTSLGFSRIAVYGSVGYKAGAWRDVEWWQRSLGASAEPPPEPVPFREFVTGHAFRAILET